MVDTPTIRNRFRKQELGSNTNTWGDTKLNEVLDCIDQALDGVETIDLGGLSAVTLTTTNYTTADQTKQRVLVFTNANSTGTAVTVPSVEHEYNCINTSGYTLTLATSAGTGITLPNARRTRIYCDAVNVYNGGTNYGGVTSPTTGSLDIAAWLAVETAIANAGIPGSAGTVRITVNDTMPNYLAAKITVNGAAISPTNPGANESLNIVIDEGQGALYAGVYAL